MAENDVFPSDDIYTVAFLYSTVPELRGKVPRLRPNGNGRVSFLIEATPGVIEALKAYQSSPSLAVGDYVRVLRRLRAIMVNGRSPIEL
jgi:hypothetical protein